MHVFIVYMKASLCIILAAVILPTTSLHFPACRSHIPLVLSVRNGLTMVNSNQSASPISATTLTGSSTNQVGLRPAIDDLTRYSSHGNNDAFVLNTADITGPF
ncbi:hypothetical protein BH10BAC6_BH10BAC6_17740 [soil metagenome]